MTRPQCISERGFPAVLLLPCCFYCSKSTLSQIRIKEKPSRQASFKLRPHWLSSAWPSPLKEVWAFAELWHVLYGRHFCPTWPELGYKWIIWFLHWRTARIRATLHITQMNSLSCIQFSNCSHSNKKEKKERKAGGLKLTFSLHIALSDSIIGPFLMFCFITVKIELLVPFSLFGKCSA